MLARLILLGVTTCGCREAQVEVGRAEVLGQVQAPGGAWAARLGGIYGVVDGQHFCSIVLRSSQAVNNRI